MKIFSFGHSIEERKKRYIVADIYDEAEYITLFTDTSAKRVKLEELEVSARARRGSLLIRFRLVLTSLRFVSRV